MEKVLEELLGYILVGFKERLEMAVHINVTDKGYFIYVNIRSDDVADVITTGKKWAYHIPPSEINDLRMFYIMIKDLKTFLDEL